MYALPDLGVLLRQEIRPYAAIEGLPGGTAIARAERSGGGNSHHDTSPAQALDGMQAHPPRTRLPVRTRRMQDQRLHFRPASPPIAAADRQPRTTACVHHARLFGPAGLNPPEPRQRSSRKAFYGEALFRWLPCLSTVRAGMDVGPEPRAVYRSVNAIRLARVDCH